MHEPKALNGRPTTVQAQDSLPERMEHALAFSTGDDHVDAMLRESIGASVTGIPELEAIYSARTAPEQALLDLHITGETVKYHTTNATALGRFVQHMAEAVKVAARELSGSLAWVDKLQVSGVAPGSVRVTLRVPDIAKPAGDRTPALTGVESSWDSQALRLIAQTLSSASDDDLEDEDEAVIGDIPLAARQALRLVAKDVKGAGWDVEGVLTQRDKPTDEVRLTTRGAQRLIDSLSSAAEERVDRTIFGVVDGVKNSRGHVYVIPDHGPSLTLASPDATLMATAARLAADREKQVRIQYTETQFFDFAGARLPTVSRTLTGIQDAV